jgi:hypothetical protein
VIVVCGEAFIDLIPGADGIQRPRPGAGRSTRCERSPGCQSQRHIVLGTDELKSALVFAWLVASWMFTRAGAEAPWRAELGDDLAGSLGTSYI